ncbi:hypothetical protein N9107_01395, partial [bacterium]|nr:hypothetical protein [bacterium]
FSRGCSWSARTTNLLKNRLRGVDIGNGVAADSLRWSRPDRSITSLRVEAFNKGASGLTGLGLRRINLDGIYQRIALSKGPCSVPTSRYV